MQGLIRARGRILFSKNEKQYNWQKKKDKRTNKGRQRTMQKTKIHLSVSALMHSGAGTAT
jgi:hypothetical protein